MPPHGGSSTGLERFTARMLELANVKEATAFPRDMTRIDSRLSDNGKNTQATPVYVNMKHIITGIVIKGDGMERN